MWTQPRQVADRINETTVRLDNGAVRNAADLVPAANTKAASTTPPASVAAAPAPKPTETRAEQPVEQPPAPARPQHQDAHADPSTLRRSQRERHPPAYLSDYVTSRLSKR